MKSSLIQAIAARGFVGVVCCATACCSLGAEGKHSVIEKSMTSAGQTWHLRAAVTGFPHTVKISGMVVGPGTEDVRDQELASVEAPTLVPGGVEFVLGSAGNVLWLVLHEKDLREGTAAHRLYPLVRARGSERQAFTNVTFLKKFNRGGQIEEKDVVRSLNLSQILRQIAKAKARKGEGLALGRGIRISNVRLESDDGDVAIVSGRLGAKYSFTGKVGLGEDHRIWARDFDIIEIEQQEDPTE